MKNHLNLNKFLLFLGIVILGSSCVPQKKLLLLQNISEDTTRTSFVNEISKLDYRVDVGDNLYIKVAGVNDETYDFFNVQAVQGTNTVMDAGLYLSSYTVNDSGYIVLPFMGSLLVKGFTVEQIRDKVQDLIKPYLSDGVVVVKLISFHVTIMGEVMRPGDYRFYQDRLNVLEAVARAGDFGPFANRERITIIRRTKRGSDIHYLNLLQNESLESDFYNLKPNDVIYVEPLKGKNFTFESFPYQVIFSTITTTLLIINFFNR
jgi:polysaccharide export outer membrane protein